MVTPVLSSLSTKLRWSLLFCLLCPPSLWGHAYSLFSDHQVQGIIPVVSSLCTKLRGHSCCVFFVHQAQWFTPVKLSSLTTMLRAWGSFLFCLLCPQGFSRSFMLGLLCKAYMASFLLLWITSEYVHVFSFWHFVQLCTLCGYVIFIRKYFVLNNPWKRKQYMNRDNYTYWENIIWYLFI